MGGTLPTVGRNARLATALLVAALAVALRWPDLRNPLLDLDDQMYALVGRRMWAGALPYVDIWDRKPIGLFLIYAAADRLAAPPLGYALLATMAAVATAWTVAALAWRTAGARAGICAATIYLVWIELLGGRAGQSPVFYNVLTAAAVWLVWRAIERPAEVRRNGLAAMALVGVALQIKPTVVFEGCWLGATLGWLAWRTGTRGIALGGLMATLLAVALLPTLLAFGAYAAIGHGTAWWFANVSSIFLRDVAGHEPLADRLLGIGLVLLVPAGAALVGLARIPRERRWFAIGWLAAAVAGVLAVPPYYNHYALPLVVPVAVLGGIGMATSRPFAMLVGLAGAGLLAWSDWPHRGEAGEAQARLAVLTGTIDRYRGDGCLFAFSAPPAFYLASGSCLPTRWPFAPHLTLAGEDGAVGVRQLAEVTRILTARPPVIVTGPPLAADVNPAVYLAVARTLRRYYVRVGGDPGYAVYARRGTQAVASR